MGKQFRKIKCRMWIGAIVRALFFGVFLGALSLAAQWVYAKQALVVLDSTRMLILIAAPAALGALIVFLILMPRNKRLATRLDNRFGLDEKVQTMIALKHDTSDMAELQRESTEEALASTRHRRVRSIFSWIFFALPLVGALAIYGALLVPIRALPPPEPERPEEIVYWQFDIYTEQKLKALAEEVRQSDMEEEPRTKVVGELEGLIIRLRSVNQETVMQEQVLRTATNIHEIVSEYNTYDVIADAMLASSSASVRNLGNSVRTLKPLLINEQLKDIGEQLTTPETPARMAGEAGGKGAVASEIAEALRSTVLRTGLSETDRLNETLLAFAEVLSGVTDATDDHTIATIIAESQETFEKTLAYPLENEIVENTTLNRLMEIFGMTLPEEFIQDNAYDPSQGDAYAPDDDQSQGGIGGIGSGDVIFGSDDTIYDPYTGEYIPFGKVIYDDNYYPLILKLLKKEDDLPADLEEMLRMYFDFLQGSEKNPAQTDNQN